MTAKSRKQANAANVNADAEELLVKCPVFEPRFFTLYVTAAVTLCPSTMDRSTVLDQIMQHSIIYSVSQGDQIKLLLYFRLKMFHKEITDIRQVALVAVPYVEYNKLLSFQKEVKKLQEQLHHHLKYKPIPSARREEPPPSETPDELPAESKTGSGDVNSTNLPPTTASTPSQLSPEIIQTIVSMVMQQLPGIAATGRGNEDLTPQVPAALPDETIDPVTAKVSPTIGEDSYETHEDSDQNLNDLDDLDQELLNTVRAGDKAKASELLIKLKGHSADIHFNSDGSIYIDGEILPDANIKKLFRFLFKPVPFRNHEHLQTVVNELSSLGLGYLLARFYSIGLSPRGRNIIKNRHEIHRNLKERSVPWYHVGND